jgi:hypothetical protein
MNTISDLKPCLDEIKTLDNLFNHPGFRLIYVDDDGSMSLITPLEHKEDILEKGYRCISHLWGNTTRWNNHPIKNVMWGVDMREDKREKLLQIFMHFKGYWWMDVFCTDQESSNKPLSIMGDVYKRCKECICMLDIKIHKFFKQDPETWVNNGKIVFKHALSFAKCKWNKRVWTIQEWFLPPKVYYTEETFEKDFHMINPQDINQVLSWEGNVARTIINLRLSISAIVLFERHLDSFTRVVRLVKSGRECTKPQDYYYGIAGICGISLTDGLSFREVEEEFLIGLKNVGFSDWFIIGKSRNEKHVYKQWKNGENYGPSGSNTINKLWNFFYNIFY